MLGLSAERSLEPRVAFLERALSCPSSSSSSTTATTTTSNPLLAKVLRSSPSLLHLSLRSGEETLLELTKRLPDAGVRSRAIAAAPSLLLVGGEKVAATLDALARVASAGLGDDDGDDGEEDGGGKGGDREEAEEKKRRLLASDLVRRHPALLRHAFTGPEAVMLPAADWLARLLSVEAGTTTAETAATKPGSERETATPPPQPPPLLALPPSSTPQGRALAAAAIRRCPALLGRSLSGLEGTASWLADRARVFLTLSSSSSSDSGCDSNSDDAFKGERRGRTRSPQSAHRTPLSLVAGTARRFPQAFGLSIANLDAKLKFLTEEVGMSDGEAAGVAVSGMPQLLGLRLASLRARAAFLLDGNDENEGEEDGEEGNDEGESGGSEERRKPASAADTVIEGEGTGVAKPIRGRRSASEIARFAPCLASSLEKLVARHAAAGERRAAAAPKKTKTTTKKKMPSLSSLLACTDEVLEGRLGLPVGHLEALQADGRVREAIERAEAAAAAKEGEKGSV